MPDLRLTLIFLHVSFILLFVLMHGASAVIAFRLRSERDPARVAALLDASRVAMNSWLLIGGLLGFVLTGVWLGFIGGYWNKIWLWASIVILVVVIAGMTPMGAIRLRRARVAYGLQTGRNDEAAPAVDLEAGARELDTWNPMPLAILGGVGLLAVLYLMVVKPF